MSCAPFQELLSAQLDDQLSEAEAKSLREHLAACAACRSLQERLVRLEQGFSQLPRVEAPPLRQRPQAVAPAPARLRPVAPALLTWSGLLAAAACAALVSWPKELSSPAGAELFLTSHRMQRQSPPGGSLALVEFRSETLRGRAPSNGKLAFELHLDSHKSACRNLQLEVDYDFDGDGKIDRKELYASFATDDREGWEVYTQQAGLVTAQGEMRDFTGGTVSAHVNNASGQVQVLSGKSKLVLPHRLSV